MALENTVQQCRVPCRARWQQCFPYAWLYSCLVYGTRQMLCAGIRVRTLMIDGSGLTQRCRRPLPRPTERPMGDQRTPTVWHAPPRGNDESGAPTTTSLVPNLELETPKAHFKNEGRICKIRIPRQPNQVESFRTKILLGQVELSTHLVILSGRAREGVAGHAPASFCRRACVGGPGPVACALPFNSQSINNITTSTTRATKPGCGPIITGRRRTYSRAASCALLLPTQCLSPRLRNAHVTTSSSSRRPP